MPWLAGTLHGNSNKVEKLSIEFLDELPPASERQVGEFVYVISEEKLYFHNGTKWRELLLGTSDPTETT